MRYNPAWLLTEALWRRSRTLNRLFAQFLDTVASDRVNMFRKKYTQYGYTLSFDASSRLVLLEKLR